jgi:hypothetical protein
MAGDPPRYLSYLLRLWRVNGPGQGMWRASLESPSGRRQGFADAAALWSFLAEQMGLGRDFGALGCHSPRLGPPPTPPSSGAASEPGAEEEYSTDAA